MNSQDHIKAIAPDVAKAYQLGKDQKYNEAYQSLLPLFEAKEIPSYFEEPCGWTIYRYLKSNENKLSSTEIRKALSFYLAFASCKPSNLHSCIMVQAVNLEKKYENDFRFIEFCQMWDLKNFRDEDFLPAKGKTESGRSIEFQSLAETVATRLYKELKSRHTEEFINELFPFFQTIKEKCPENRFIGMYIAQLYYWRNNIDKAIAEYKGILRTTPEWFIWKHLGDICDDADVKISMYCKAMTMMGKDEYIGELRLNLAQLLLESNKEQAAYEVEQYMNTYRANGWNIAGDVYILQGKLKGFAPSSQSKAFYRNNVEKAEKFAYSDIPVQELVFEGTFKNQGGKERAKLVNKKKHNEIRTSLTPLLRKANVGEVFFVRLIKRNGRFIPLTIHKSGKIVETNVQEQNNGKGVVATKKTITGIISLPLKGDFAFIDHTYYVPASIRKRYSLKEGQKVNAEVSIMTDGRWRVVTIRES